MLPEPVVEPNPLARPLAETALDLSAVRQLHAAERDYMAWLQLEVCRARQWTVPDVLAAWFAELDRRAAARAKFTGGAL